MKKHIIYLLVSGFALLSNMALTSCSDDDVEDANDVLAETDGTVTWFDGARINNPNTHGTGCTLSSAIACALAQGMELADAVNAGKAYLTGALAAGFDMGKGSGPVNHMWQY